MNLVRSFLLVLLLSIGARAVVAATAEDLAQQFKEPGREYSPVPLWW